MSVFIFIGLGVAIISGIFAFLSVSIGAATVAKALVCLLPLLAMSLLITTQPHSAR